MATQNIDLGRVEEVTYDGNDVDHVKLNGTTIWSGCYAGGSYSQPGFSDDPTSPDYAQYRVYESYRRWPPHWEQQSQFDTNGPGSSTGYGGSGFWRTIAGGYQNPGGTCVAPKCGYYHLSFLYSVPGGARFGNGNPSGHLHTIKVGVFVNNVERFRLATVNLNYIERHTTNGAVGQTLDSTYNSFGLNGHVSGTVWEKPSGGTTTASDFTYLQCPGFLSKGDMVTLKGYISVHKVGVNAITIVPYFSSGHIRLDGGMHGP